MEGCGDGRRREGGGVRKKRNENKPTFEKITIRLLNPLSGLCPLWSVRSHTQVRVGPRAVDLNALC